MHDMHTVQEYIHKIYNTKHNAFYEILYIHEIIFFHFFNYIFKSTNLYKNPHLYR